MFKPGYDPVTIDPKSKGTVLNLFIKTGNHMATSCDLLTPLPLGAISSAIDIYNITCLIKQGMITPLYINYIILLYKYFHMKITNL